MEFRTTIDIQAPPDRVWAIMLDVERWHEWTPSITRIERLDGGPFDIGSRARVKQPRALPAIWRVTALEPGQSFTWVTERPGVHAAGVHAVEASGNGCRATLAVVFGGPLGKLVGRLLKGMTERYLRMEAEGLKARAEAAGPT